MMINDYHILFCLVARSGIPVKSCHSGFHPIKRRLSFFAAESIISFGLCGNLPKSNLSGEYLKALAKSKQNLFNSIDSPVPTSNFENQSLNFSLELLKKH